MRLLLLFSFMLSGCGAMTMIQIPDTLKPLGAFHIVKRLHVAEGLAWQMYECQEKDGRKEWAFKAPLAVLLDEEGKEWGMHGPGPVWVDREGRVIRAKVEFKIPSPDPRESVDELRLAVVQSETFDLGGGYILRVRPKHGQLYGPCEHTGTIRVRPYEVEAYLFVSTTTQH